MKKALVILLFFVSAVFCFARDTLSLDEALKNIQAYLTERIPKGVPVVVLSVTAALKDYDPLCLYIQDSLIEVLEDGKITVIDRENTEKIESERDYQASGTVNEDDIIGMGDELGGQIIIFGSLEKAGSNYRLTVRAIDVKTRAVIGSRGLEVRHDGKIEHLLPAFMLHVGVRGGYIIHSYVMSDSFGDALAGKSYGYNFLFGAVQTTFYFTDSLAVQIEAVYNRDIVEYSGVETYLDNKYPYKATFDSMSLMVPMLVRYDFRPGLFVLGVMAGPYFTIPAGDMEYNTRYDNGYLLEGQDADYPYSVPLGLIIGGTAGIRLGPGTLFTDIRYGIDLGNTSVASYGIMDIYKRNFVSFTLGYEVGFIKRRIK